MGIQRRNAEPAGIVNGSGQPEIVLEIDGLVLRATPPSASPTASTAVPTQVEPDE